MTQWPANNQYHLYLADPSNTEFRTPYMTVTAGNVQVLSVVKNGATDTSYLDGVAQGSATVPSALKQLVVPLMLGARAGTGSSFDGQIAEVLVYNRALTATERQSVEAALASRYIAADSDNDGLPDAWEQKYFGSLSHGATDDPGSVGRTLQQSYQQGLSPWPVATMASGLKAWYRADLGLTQDGSNKVSQWADLSGSGFHVVQATTGQQPTAVAAAMNGKPVVTFDATAQTNLQTNAVAGWQGGSNDLTVIAVMKPDATQVARGAVVYWGDDQNSGYGLISGWVTNQYWLRYADGGGSEFVLPTITATAGQIQVVSAVKGGTTGTSYLNGTLQGSGTVPATILAAVSPLALGNWAINTSYGFNGQIAEVLVYNRADGHGAPERRGRADQPVSQSGSYGFPHFADQRSHLPCPGWFHTGGFGQRCGRHDQQGRILRRVHEAG